MDGQYLRICGDLDCIHVITVCAAAGKDQFVEIVNVM